MAGGASDERAALVGGKYGLVRAGAGTGRAASTFRSGAVSVLRHQHRLSADVAESPSLLASRLRLPRVDADDSGPIADLSPADSDVGRGISPWVVVVAIAVLVAVLVGLAILS